MEHRKGIEILTPGALTTVQDLGRIGYGEQGFSPSGAVDRKAMEIANILVGNRKDEAVLECTLIGPMLRFSQSAVIAFTGADMKGKLIRELGEEKLEMQIPIGKAIAVCKGDILQMGIAATGCRGYLAVAGGFQIEIVLGSKSLHQKCKLGGEFGRPLQAGDILQLTEEVEELPDMEKRVSEESTKMIREIGSIQNAKATKLVHIVLGPQDNYFTKAGLQKLIEGTYQISNDSNRMACKLTGPEIESIKGSDIISDGIALGAVQVSSNGQPIIMLTDRQTTGGYAKIGTVISTDISILAQCKPGDQIRFVPISLRQAQKRYRSFVRRINKLEKRLCVYR